MFGSAHSQVKKFNFYESNYVENYSLKISNIINKDSRISCVTGARSCMVIATADGHLIGIDKFFDNVIFNFKAFKNDITHVVYNKKQGILFVLGIESTLCLNNALKIYEFQNLKMDSVVPLNINDLEITANKRKSMIMSICVDEKMEYIAFGYDDGTIAIIKNDILYMKKHRTILLKEFKVPITNLSIVETSKHGNLFITTTECVAVYNLNQKDYATKCTILDKVDVALGNSSILSTKIGYEFIVGTREAIQSYNHEGRCQYLRVDGEKSKIRCIRDNIIFAISNIKPHGNSSFGGVHNKQKNESCSIIILGFNKNMKYYAFEKQITCGITDIVYEWGCFYVFCYDGQLLKIIVKDFETRLNFLYKKNLYNVALNVAKDNGDHRYVIETHKKYGDHLFSQGDMKNSINQFIETIGFLEPSYIIHKFIDTQNMNHLTTYLEKLHELNLALIEHTTLLLNCYIKLNDIENMDKFLDQQDDITFDLETAIRVCHQAKLYHHALKLSKKSHNTMWNLKILVEDLNDYKGAMEFISSFSNLLDICESLKKYGKLLLTHLPQQVLDCLKKIVVIYPDCNIHQFLHIFIGNDLYLKDFLEFIIKTNEKCDSSIYNLLMELYANEYTNIEDQAAKIQHEIKFIKLLNQYQSFLDMDHLLMILHANDFTVGIVWVYEKKQLLNELLYYYADKNEFESILSLCKTYGDKCPNLWKLALSRISSKIDSDPTIDNKKYIKIIMGCLQHDSHIDPLNILQTMHQHSNTITFGNVKDYFTNYLQVTENKLNSYQHKINEQKDEINQMESTLKNIDNGVKIFQNTKCSICNKILELPCIHFLCGHSFHSLCCQNYNGSEDTCPKCQQKIKNFIDSQNVVDYKQLNSEFYNEVSENPDHIALFEKYLKLGLFSSHNT